MFKAQEPTKQTQNSHMPAPSTSLASIFAMAWLGCAQEVGRILEYFKTHKRDRTSECTFPRPLQSGDPVRYAKYVGTIFPSVSWLGKSQRKYRSCHGIQYHHAQRSRICQSCPSLTSSQKQDIFICCRSFLKTCLELPVSTDTNTNYPVNL